jgi:hypothetical protein
MVIHATARNTVWAVADNHLLIELAPDGRILHQYSHEHETINICFGQRNGGIEFFYFTTQTGRPAKETLYSVDENSHRQQLPHSLLKSLNRYVSPVAYAFDRTGLIWDGISLQDSVKGAILKISGHTGGESITNRSFHRDRSGRFWLGTSFGVYQVNITENNFRRLFYQEDRAADSLLSIRGITVQGDSIFVNLEKFGLYSSPLPGDAPTRLDPPNSFPSNSAPFANAIGLAQDLRGILISSIGNRLVRYDTQKATYAAAELPGGSDVWALYPFSSRQWLLGSRNRTIF